MVSHTPKPHNISPPTENTFSSKEPSALVRSTKKLRRILFPFVDNNQFDIVTPPQPPPPARSNKEDAWRTRKPTHIPNLINLSGGSAVNSNSPHSSPCTPHTQRTGSLSTSSPQSSVYDHFHTQFTEATNKYSKMERGRKKPKEQVSPVASERFHEIASSQSSRPPHDDTVALSIDRHRVVLKTSTRANNHPYPQSSHSSHHPHKSSRCPPPLSMSGLPPTLKPSHNHFSDEAGLLGPRKKSAAGSNIGGADFKAARRAKQKGFGEIEMVGFSSGF